MSLFTFCFKWEGGYVIEEYDICNICINCLYDFTKYIEIKIISSWIQGQYKV